MGEYLRPTPHKLMGEIPIGDPESLENIIGDEHDPDLCVPLEFAFRPQTREWWIRVVGNKCQFEYYDENYGWIECGRKVDQVHHILPEGWQLTHGLDPEHSTGLPLCKHHHMNFDEHTLEPVPHTKHFSFHPDMGKAFSDYKYFREEQIRVLRTLGTGAARSLKDPFRITAEGHREQAGRGERYWSGTEEIDKYYFEKMAAKAFIYVTQTGDHRPDTSPHPRSNGGARHWYDEYFGK